MAAGDCANKEAQVPKKEKATDREESPSAVILPNPEKPKELVEEKEATATKTNEKTVESEDSISIFINFLVILFLPIKPFYESLKSANPVFNKMSQMFEERVVYILKFVLSASTWISAWNLLKQVIDGIKKKVANFFFGNLDPVWTTVSLYYYQVHESAPEIVDNIDRIYLNIVPALPNAVPYFDSTDRNLSIKTRCLYMFLNLVHRLIVHSLTFVEHTLRKFERKTPGAAVER